MNTVNFHKATTYLTAAITVVLVSLISIDPACGQQLDQALAHVDNETSVLVRIDSETFDDLIDITNQQDQDLGQTVLQQRLNQTRKILDGDPIWLTIGFPLPPLKIRILVHDPDGKRIETLKEMWDFPKSYPNGLEQQITIKRLSELSSKKPADAARMDQWKKLMASAKKATESEKKIQFACLPPAYLYDTYRELQVSLPDYLGGGPVSLLTDGLQSASGTIELKNGILDGVINSASPAAATAFADRATELMTRRRAARLMTAAKQLLVQQETDEHQNLHFGPIVQQLEQSTFQSVEGQVRWQIPADEDWKTSKLIKLFVGPMANRSIEKRMRNLALGVLNYESANRHLPPPPESRGPERQKGLSWRVHILPFLGEADLFNQFAIDEPWDSETNIKLLPKMPAIYSDDYGSKLLAPDNAKPGYTTIVAPISENTIIGSPKRVTIGSITDGTSNTILVVTVKDSLAVPWTAPQDYVFDRDKPAAGLKFTNGKTTVAFCDASDRSLVENNDWLGLFEMNDEKIVQPRE